jgi:hypothetical protein
MLPLPDVLPDVWRYVFQALRTLPILGSHFEYDVVLIHLRVDDETLLTGRMRIVELRVQRLYV